MRWLALLLVSACARPAPRAPLAHTSAPAEDAPGFRGRVTTGPSRTEVVVLGTDQRARALCDAFIAAQARRATAARVDACTTAALPAVRRAPVELVVDLPWSEAAEQARSLGLEPLPEASDGPGPRAVVTMSTPAFDATSCEVMRAQHAAENAAETREQQQQNARALAEQLGEVIRAETRACAIGHRSDGEPVGRTCAEARVKRAHLEDLARNPPKRPAPPVARCVVR